MHRRRFPLIVGIVAVTLLTSPLRTLHAQRRVPADVAAEFRNPGVATLAGVIIPGAGHLYAGERARGLAVLLGVPATTGIAVALDHGGHHRAAGLALVAPIALWVYDVWDAGAAAHRTNRRLALRATGLRPVFEVGAAGTTHIGLVVPLGTRHAHRAAPVPPAPPQPPAAADAPTARVVPPVAPPAGQRPSPHAGLRDALPDPLPPLSFDQAEPRPRALAVTRPDPAAHVATICTVAFVLDRSTVLCKDGARRVLSTLRDERSGTPIAPGATRDELATRLPIGTRLTVQSNDR